VLFQLEPTVAYIAVIDITMFRIIIAKAPKSLINPIRHARKLSGNVIVGDKEMHESYKGFLPRMMTLQNLMDTPGRLEMGYMILRI
jgi:hypothetical protein